MFEKHRNSLAVWVLLLLAPLPVQADMGPRWEEPRATSNALSSRACNGDQAAYAQLVDRADFGAKELGEVAATARASLAWLTINSGCESYFTGDEVKAANFYLDAAEAGYPLALGMVAVRSIQGLGMPRQPEVGLNFANRSLRLGYGDVGAFIAQEYISGKHLERNEAKARDWLAQAKAAGARQVFLDETASMLDHEFGAVTASTASPGAWLPALSGKGFHRVGNTCVMRNGVMTVATGADRATSGPTLIGISNDDWDFSGQLGREQNAPLTVQVNLFDGGPRFTGKPRAGDDHTLVIGLGPDAMSPLWERLENKCMFNRDAGETVYYKLGDGGQVYFDAADFFQPEVWSQFKSCSGVFFLSSFGECQ
ncbi:MAG: hypothetical protein ACE5DK_10725 [Paracoccaceae bacterium]